MLEKLGEKVQEQGCGPVARRLVRDMFSKLRRADVMPFAARVDSLA